MGNIVFSQGHLSVISTRGALVEIALSWEVRLSMFITLIGSVVFSIFLCARKSDHHLSFFPFIVWFSFARHFSAFLTSRCKGSRFVLVSGSFMLELVDW